jgi:2'-5' RNA ligase
MAETAVVVTVAAAAAIVETPAGGIPAHVTLLYPFADGSQIAGMLDDLESELRRFPRFMLTLRRLDRFSCPPAVVYAVPDPQERFLAMTDALTARFGFAPYGGEHSEVIPHLTIAISDEPVALDAVERDAARSLPISELVDAVEVWEHDSAAWRRLHIISLSE